MCSTPSQISSKPSAPVRRRRSRNCSKSAGGGSATTMVRTGHVSEAPCVFIPYRGIRGVNRRTSQAARKQTAS